MMRSWWSFAGLLSFVLTLAGCGGRGNEVKLVAANGVVTFEGKTLNGATITLVPENGPIAIGLTDASGKFTMMTGSCPGVVVGKCRVSVTLAGSEDENADLSNLSESERNEILTQRMGKNVGQFGADRKPSPLPSKYASTSTSGLEVTVTDNPDKNVFELKL